MNRLGSIILLYLIPWTGFALERPTTAEANKVIEYYREGKGNGAILTDTILCEKVVKKNCETKITGNIISKGDKIKLWMSYMVPIGDKASLIIQIKYKNKVRRIKEISISASIRYRVNIDLPSNKLGKWSVVIIQEGETDDVDLGSFDYEVTAN